MTRSPFQDLASVYAAARPTYPDGIYDALPLAGATVADVGAGTGISTRGMLARGARVVAFDLAPAMLARVGAHPALLLGTAVADAHALPLRDASLDLVTYAQAFHWTTPERAVAEARRVLRPGGALALWWNHTAARDETWWQVQQDALESLSDGYSRDYRERDHTADLATAFEDVTTIEVPWVRELDVETYVVYLSSKSYVAALGERMPGFLDGQRELLAATFADGVVREPFVTRLWLAR
ncbi:MAG TPA: class I SAM-dependent methyltransferase [Frankiaceae bacterium]|nr:class I SAM-dependent methyltransferase [Frankiaceae bacterium]